MNYTNNGLFRFVCRLLVVSLVWVGMPISTSHAAMIGTDVVVDAAQAQQVRARLGALLERADVQAALKKQGVTPEAARDRVAALTDDEASRMAGQLDKLPAGGSDVLAVIVIIFVVLLVTDILGLTKVFPFTRPISR